MSEPDVSNLLSVSQAIEVIDAEPVQPPQVGKTLVEAFGRRLAQEVASDRDYPPFDKSLMDGFAVRSQDVRASDPPAELRVVATVAAGQWSDVEVRQGQAAAIMTGAPLPSGADAVVPVEY